MSLQEMVEPGWSLHINASRTRRGIGGAAHAYRLIVSPDEVYQMEFTADRDKGWPHPWEQPLKKKISAWARNVDQNLLALVEATEKQLEEQDLDAARAALLHIEKGLAEFARHLHVGEYAWEIYSRLYYRYEVLKATLMELPGSNLSHAYTEEQYYDPKFTNGDGRRRRAEPVDVVVVTSLPDEDKQAVVAANEESKRTNAINYNLRAQGDTFNCGLYLNLLMNQVGQSDMQLLGVEEGSVFSRDTRYAIGDLLEKREREDAEAFRAMSFRVPVDPDGTHCIHVYNILLEDGKTYGTVIVNPLGSPPLDPLKMTEIAWDAGAILNLDAIRQPESLREQECREVRAERDKGLIAKAISSILGGEPGNHLWERY